MAESRTYRRQECVVFRKTDERFGGLSNMARGFPISVAGVRFLNSEALYQACRFPQKPEVQQLIIAEASPMTAKMKSKKYRRYSRQDWDSVRVNIMRWCLRLKLAQNWQGFSDLLLATGQKAIVEESRKDAYWGAKPAEQDTLVGANVLGRLLMELREELRSPNSNLLKKVTPPDIPDLLLLDKRVETVEAQETDRRAQPQQGLAILQDHFRFRRT